MGEGKAKFSGSPVEDLETLGKDDFVNEEVLQAINPHPVTGYAHGPIPNNNPGWRPVGCPQRGVHVRDIVSAVVKGQGPTRPFALLNVTNTFVCDVLVTKSTMCGAVFNNSASICKHMREEHTGAVFPMASVENKNSLSGRNAAIIALNSIRLWVLTGGWRDASYRLEPGRGGSHSVLGAYCDLLEKIAGEDAQFAAKYGTSFHRPPEVHLMYQSLKPMLIEPARGSKDLPMVLVGDKRSMELDSACSGSEAQLRITQHAHDHQNSEFDPDSEFDYTMCGFDGHFEADSDLLPCQSDMPVIKFEVGRIGMNDIAFEDEPQIVSIKTEAGHVPVIDLMRRHARAVIDLSGDLRDVPIKSEPGIIPVIDLVSKDKDIGTVIDLVSDDESDVEEPQEWPVDWPVDDVADVFSGMNMPSTEEPRG